MPTSSPAGAAAGVRASSTAPAAWASASIHAGWVTPAVHTRPTTFPRAEAGNTCTLSAANTLANSAEISAGVPAAITGSPVSTAARSAGAASSAIRSVPKSSPCSAPRTPFSLDRTLQDAENSGGVTEGQGGIYQHRRHLVEIGGLAQSPQGLVETLAKLAAGTGNTQGYFCFQFGFQFRGELRKPFIHQFPHE